MVSDGYAVSTTKEAGEIRRILDKFLVRRNQLTATMETEAVRTSTVLQISLVPRPFRSARKGKKGLVKIDRFSDRCRNVGSANQIASSGILRNFIPRERVIRVPIKADSQLKK